MARNPIQLLQNNASFLLVNSKDAATERNLPTRSFIVNHCLASYHACQYLVLGLSANSETVCHLVAPSDTTVRHIQDVKLLIMFTGCVVRARSTICRLETAMQNPPNPAPTGAAQQSTTPQMRSIETTADFKCPYGLVSVAVRRNVRHTSLSVRFECIFGKLHCTQFTKT